MKKRKSFFAPSAKKFVIFLVINSIAVFTALEMAVFGLSWNVFRIIHAILVPLEIFSFVGYYITNLQLIVFLQLFVNITALLWHYVIACAIVQYFWKR